MPAAGLSLQPLAQTLYQVPANPTHAQKLCCVMGVNFPREATLLSRLLIGPVNEGSSAIFAQGIQEAPDCLHGEGGSPAPFGCSIHAGRFVRADTRGSR
jgi:hypothetical protein